MRNSLPYFVARAPLSVRLKLLGAFFVLIALLILFGLIGLQVLGEMSQRAEKFLELQRKSNAYRQLQHDTTTQLYSVTSALLSPNDRSLDGALRHLNQFRYDLDRVRFVSPDEADLFKRIRDRHEQLTSVVTRVVNSTRAGSVSDALELRRIKANPLADNIMRLTNEMVNRAEAQMLEEMDINQRAYVLSRFIVIGFGAASIGLALIMVYAISSSLTRPIEHMEKRLVRIAGGDFSQRVSVPNRDELGTLAEYLNSMTQQLKTLYAQIETASHHKSQFLAYMSHELRTPLNAIIGYSEMLIENAEAGGTTLVDVSDLEKIRISARHLVTLIANVLDLSKIEAGKMEYVIEKVELDSLIQEVITTVKPLAEKNQTLLSLQLPEPLGFIYSDATRIRQILLNLLGNACKFTEQGSVVLHAGWHWKNGQKRLRASVHDTGIGMTEDQVSRLFQPFSQAEAWTARRFGGTGLGLVIATQICEHLGGSISVDSCPGKGTTVMVTLPDLPIENGATDGVENEISISLSETQDATNTLGGRQRA